MDRCTCIDLNLPEMKFRFTSPLNILDKYKDTCAWNCLWMTMKYMYIYFTCIHGDFVILNKTIDFHFQVGLCTTCAILLHEVPHEVCTSTTAVSLSLFGLKELTVIMLHSIFIYITNFFFNIKSYTWELVLCQRWGSCMLILQYVVLRFEAELSISEDV